MKSGLIGCVVVRHQLAVFGRLVLWYDSRFGCARSRVQFPERPLLLSMHVQWLRAPARLRPSQGDSIGGSLTPGTAALPPPDLELRSMRISIRSCQLPSAAGCRSWSARWAAQCVTSGAGVFSAGAIQFFKMKLGCPCATRVRAASPGLPGRTLCSTVYVTWHNQSALGMGLILNAKQ